MQGQSGYTRFKQERFTPVLSQSLRISKAPRVALFPYYHIDLNAGSGYNEDVEVQGSPLNFLEAAQRNDRRNFYAFFIDKERNYVRELTGRSQLAACSDRAFVFEGDNAELLPIVGAFIVDCERRPRYAMGSVLVDPNGYHNGVPWDALREFCAAFPRIDVLMNLNVRSFRMERAHIEAGARGWEAYTVRHVSAFPHWFSRPNWMITAPLQIRGSSWIQLVGRTIATHRPGYESLGFYDFRSTYGQSILASLETSRTDLQPSLLLQL